MSTCPIRKLKPPKFVTNSPDLEFGGGLKFSQPASDGLDRNIDLYPLNSTVHTRKHKYIIKANFRHII